MNRAQARRKRGSSRISQGPSSRVEKIAKWSKYGPAMTMEFWRSRVDRPVFTYFIGERSPEFDDCPNLARIPDAVKIGHALDPSARVGELQCGNPRRLVLEEVLLGGSEVERAWHERWAGARMLGEWFGDGYQEAIMAAAHAFSLRQTGAWMEGQRTGLESVVLIEPDSMLEKVA